MLWFAWTSPQGDRTRPPESHEVTDVTDDLVSFLRARLDEDEAAAKACYYADWEAGSEGDVVPVRPEGNSYVAVGPWGGGMDDADVRHIARHDPARVLRDVEARRAVLAEHKPDTDGHCWVCLTTRDRWKEDWPLDKWPCRTIRTVAAVYSDHADYRQEWDAPASRP